MDSVNKNYFIRSKAIRHNRSIQSRINRPAKKMFVSIMTDTELGWDVCQPVYPRRQKSRSGIASRVLVSTNHSSSCVVLTVKEKPIVPSVTWTLIGKNDNAQCVKLSASPNPNSSKFSISWYRRLKRDILKSVRTKVFPQVGNG